MTIIQLSAEVMVSDHEAAVVWYTRVLGRGPDRRPMDGLAEWQLTDTGSLQVFAEPSKAGKSGVTIEVDDLDAHVDGLDGIVVEQQSTARGQRLAILNDSDGNLVVFAQQPQLSVMMSPGP